MNALNENPASSPYSARNTAKPANFYCWAPNAKTVYLVGDFNSWDPTAFPMMRRHDGWWFAQLLLCHGHHGYVFMVDGSPMLDPQATGVTRNENVSLMAVS